MASGSRTPAAGAWAFWPAVLRSGSGLAATGAPREICGAGRSSRGGDGRRQPLQLGAGAVAVAAVREAFLQELELFDRRLAVGVPAGGARQVGVERPRVEEAGRRPGPPGVLAVDGLEAVDALDPARARLLFLRGFADVAGTGIGFEERVARSGPAGGAGPRRGTEEQEENDKDRELYAHGPVD